MKPRRVAVHQREELPGEEVVIVDPRTQRAVVLNAIGGAVWDLCDGGRSLEAIADFICAQLPSASRPQVVADVEALVRRLLEAGLLEDAG